MIETINKTNEASDELRNTFSFEQRELWPDQIQADFSIYCRTLWDDQIVEEYTDAFKRGDTFPPIICYYDGEVYHLCDGFLRLAAWKRAFDDKKIPVEIRHGTQADAGWFATGVNQRHGLRRSREDLQLALSKALLHENGALLSDRSIAAHVGCARATVAKLRRTLQGQGQLAGSDWRKASDGRQMRTAPIGVPRKMENPDRTRLFEEYDQVPCTHSKPRSVSGVTHVRGGRNVVLYDDQPMVSAVEIRHMFGEKYLKQLVEAAQVLLNDPETANI